MAETPWCDWILGYAMVSTIANIILLISLGRAEKATLEVLDEWSKTTEKQVSMMRKIVADQHAALIARTESPDRANWN